MDMRQHATSNYMHRFTCHYVISGERSSSWTLGSGLGPLDPGGPWYLSSLVQCVTPRVSTHQYIATVMSFCDATSLSSVSDQFHWLPACETSSKRRMICICICIIRIRSSVRLHRTSTCQPVSTSSRDAIFARPLTNDSRGNADGKRSFPASAPIIWFQCTFESWILSPSLQNCISTSCPYTFVT